MSKYRNVKKKPPCDFCREPAYADARLEKISPPGSWAYVCRKHFDLYGCELGTGHGQELVVR